MTFPSEKFLTDNLMGVPSVKLPLKSLLFIMPFNFGSYYQQWYKQMYILKIVLIN